MQDKLTTVIADTGIDRAKAESIWVQFEPFFRSLHECTDKVIGLEITDVSQKKEMAWARKTRLKLKNVRTSAEKTKKQLKAGILKEGRFIDATYNLIAKATRPLEANLKEKEEFAQRKEAERKEALRKERIQVLSPLDVVGLEFLKLEDMDDHEYGQLLRDSRLAYEERIARENAEAEERARAQAEMERVRQEQAEREHILARQREEIARDMARQLKAERAKAETARQVAEEAARKEREAREELRKAQEEKEEAEREEKWRKEAERVRLEQAGDKEKLTAYLESALAIEMPQVRSIGATSIVEDLQNAFSVAATEVAKLGWEQGIPGWE